MEQTTKGTPMSFGPRRGGYFPIADELAKQPFKLEPGLLASLERADLAYRTVCAILYNFVPQSGHPGGSVSSGRIVQSLLFHTMDYDFTDPDAMDADLLSYAAGHKAMGLYAAWALRNEFVRIAHPDLLPDTRKQLRLEDLLGFRRNPRTDTPLFKKFEAKALDGHPSPATPFIKLATGASGVGVAASIGLALGAMDQFGAEQAPWVHIIEGEGGMTPGRVSEALATASTSRLNNLVMHLDWNQASIDSNRVCREGENVGDYVQWSPAELFYLQDWNTIVVPDGFDFEQIIAAQKLALTKPNGQPTGIVYRTTKGWRYGIEGRASHGAGHAFCSEPFYASLADFEKAFEISFPRFSGDKRPEAVEQNFFDCLSTIRIALEKETLVARTLGEQIAQSRKRLQGQKRKPRPNGPDLAALYSDPALTPEKAPVELELKPGQSVTLRGVLGDVAGYLNRKTRGAFLGASADLLESTSLSLLNKTYPSGFYNAASNPGSRIISAGGICEDGMGGVLSGISAFGAHIGMGSSYGAFIAALQHITARLHAIGQQAKALTFGDPQKPLIVVCAHAGPKTGEDGPTHADPQALQLMQENFPRGSAITLTPWDPQEIWPLMIAALKARPAVLVPFVTRPNETLVDRKALGLPPAAEAVNGVYALRKADPSRRSGTVVLQGNGVTSAFVNEVLPYIEKKKWNLNAYAVVSAELFDALPASTQESVFPEEHMRDSMGITEFTLATMYRWVASSDGRRRTLHPFRSGHFLGSGQASKVFQEGRLDAQAQIEALEEYVRQREI